MQKLFLVSTGPGHSDFLTTATRNAIDEVSDIVGYGLYLDLLDHLVKEKVCHTTNLGEEIDRAALALNLASEGKATALVSSGDVGIYAMASVVFELMERQELNGESYPHWGDVEVRVVPGISAMQAASSRVGALLGHDFCTISLSNLLTPWQTIEKRIHSAGQGDFAVSFYNPVSKKRDWQLDRAVEILLEYRPAATPAILARNVTRPTERIQQLSLSEIRGENVDMFTLVSVGNSESRRFTTSRGSYIYTPRGYSGKL